MVSGREANQPQNQNTDNTHLCICYDFPRGLHLANNIACIHEQTKAQTGISRPEASNKKLQ